MGDEDTVSKPVAGFDDFEACVMHFEGRDDVDDPEALCSYLERDGKEALEDPNADEVLTDLTVEFVSAVDEPAQDSQWVIAKDAEGPDGDTHRWATETPLLLKRADADDGGDTDKKQVAFAPVLIPGEADKQGDVIPPHEIERAAHDYIANHRKVDTDHDLLDGAGVPVESWVAKSPTTFELPDGSQSREYPDGTWFMGVRFDDDAWERVKSGDLSGFSIYGGARPVDLSDIQAAFESTKAIGFSDTQTMKDILSKQLGTDELASFADALGQFLSESEGTVEGASLEAFFEWATGDRVDELDDEVEVGSVTIPIRSGGSDGDDDEEMVESNDEDVIDALKAVADAVDDLDDRVDALEDGGYMSPRMGDDGENNRMSARLKSVLGDDGGEPNRKARAEQVAKDGDGGTKINYEGITDGEAATARSGGSRRSTANKRMTEINGGD